MSLRFAASKTPCRNRVTSSGSGKGKGGGKGYGHDVKESLAFSNTGRAS
jgi:hypothetical protein